MTTTREVLDFAKKVGVDLSQKEATEIAAWLPDDDLEEAAGGAPPVFPFKDAVPNFT